MSRAVDRQILYLFGSISVILILFELYIGWLAFVFVEPLLLGSIFLGLISTCSIILLIYERAIIMAEKKLLYLAREITPFSDEFYQGHSLIWGDFSIGQLDIMRKWIKPNTRFLLFLSLVPSSYIRLIDDIYVKMVESNNKMKNLQEEIKMLPKMKGINVRIDDLINHLILAPQKEIEQREKKAAKIIEEYFQSHSSIVEELKIIGLFFKENVPKIRSQWIEFLRDNALPSGKTVSEMLGYSSELC